MYSSKFWLFFFGIFVTISVVLFFQHTQTIEIEIAKTDQISRAENIRKKIDEFSVISNLLSHFIQQDLNGKKYTKIEIEQKLIQYLRSGPNDLIYGVGIWYEPFKFDKNISHFGPYVHQSSLNPEDHNYILTYEWNTKEYNYPTQNWYLQGIAAKGESFFVNPYFDNGLVYITNSRAFYNSKKQIVGVISVDLVLPQLQNMIINANSTPDELISIVDREGNVLAHPLKNDFFKAKNIKEGTSQSQSLLNFKISDINAALKINNSNWIRSEITQKSFGWKIFVESSEQVLIKRIHELKKFLSVSIIGIWIFIFVIFKVLHIIQKEKLAQQKNIEQSKLQLIHSSKMAALGEMASSVAHEINNPLTLIIGKIYLIKGLIKKQDVISSEINDKLDQIITNSNRIKRITDGLKTLSKTGSQDPLTKEYLNTIILNSIALCSEKFKSSDIKLDFFQTSNIEVQCHSSQLSQVFLSLLLNSYDAVIDLPEKWIRINVDMNNDKKRINIFFTDSGDGISPTIRSRILEPFFTTKPIGSGSGLGLSIAKGIIENHQGTLTYNEHSKNTQFIISLPII